MGDFFDDDDEAGPPQQEDMMFAALPEGSERPSTNDSKCDLFMPGSVFQDLNEELLPMNSIDELPPGTLVWVVDPANVALLLKRNWIPEMYSVCDGLCQGTVVRHQEVLTLVEFNVGGVVLRFSLPRVCLSKIPVLRKNQPPPQLLDLAQSAHLGPRVAAREKLNPSDEFCEMSLGLFCDSLTPAMELALGGRIQEAYEIVDKCGDKVDKNECLVCRSYISMYANQPEKGLKEVLQCIQDSPNFVTAYLCAARLYASCGMLSLANRYASQALRIDPRNEACLRKKQWIATLCELQNRLGHLTLQIRTTPQLFKQLVAKRAYEKGTEIFTDRAVAAVPSFANASISCASCFRSCRGEKCPLASVDAPYTTLFCSDTCRQAAAKQFLRYESEEGSFAVRSCRYILANRTDKYDTSNLNSGLLALQLFSILIQKTRELGPPYEENVHRALEELALTPIPVVQPSIYRKDLASLYTVFVTPLSEAERNAFSFTLFETLIRCAMHCGRTVRRETDMDGIDIFVVAPLVSAVSNNNPKVKFVLHPNGTIAAVASEHISSDECL